MTSLMGYLETNNMALTVKIITAVQMDPEPSEIVTGTDSWFGVSRSSSGHSWDQNVSSTGENLDTPVLDLNYPVQETNNCICMRVLMVTSFRASQFSQFHV